MKTKPTLTGMSSLLVLTTGCVSANDAAYIHPAGSASLLTPRAQQPRSASPLPTLMKTTMSAARSTAILIRVPVLIACLFLVFEPVLLKAAGDEREMPRALSDAHRYVDANGYFSATPPSRWRQKVFPGEKVRSKIEFVHPDGKGLSIRVIVAPIENPGLSLDAFLAEVQDKITTVIRPRFPSIKAAAFKEEVAGREAVVMTLSGPGIEQRVVQYLHNGLNYSVALNATGEKSFSANADAFNRFLELFTIQGAGVEVSEADRTLAQISRFKRLAVLEERSGNPVAALDWAAQGLAINPQDLELRQIRQRLSGGDEPEPAVGGVDSEDKPQSATHKEEAQENARPDLLSPENTRFSFYVASFFLLWFPPLGVVAAIAVGYAGFRFAIAPTSGFAPIAIFWFLVTAVTCFQLAVSPFIMIWNAWSAWYAAGRVIPFLLCAAGGVALGMLSPKAVRLVRERISPSVAAGGAGQRRKRQERFPNKFTIEPNRPVSTKG